MLFVGSFPPRRVNGRSPFETASDAIVIPSGAKQSLYESVSEAGGDF
jgi:hypothetical protein